jgi:hypothetical protein
MTTRSSGGQNGAKLVGTPRAVITGRRDDHHLGVVELAVGRAGVNGRGNASGLQRLDRIVVGNKHSIHRTSPVVANVARPAAFCRAAYLLVYSWTNV